MKFLVTEYNDILFKLDRIKYLDEWAEKTLEELGEKWECSASLGGNFQSAPYVNLIFWYKKDFNGFDDKSKGIIYLTAGVRGQWIRLDRLHVRPMIRTEITVESDREVQHKLSKMCIKDVPMIIDLMKAIPTICECDPNPMSYFEKRLMEYEKKKKIEEDFKKRRKSK